jgi:O-antigen/teichoic acid export membrane protein
MTTVCRMLSTTRARTYPHVMDQLKTKVYRLLRWSERYTKTDMVYVGKSGFWLALYQGVGALISFAMSILVARYVSKDTFGIYKYILSVAGFTSAFSLTGMNTAIMRAVSQGRDGTFAKSLPLQLKWTIGQFAVTMAIAAYYTLKGNTAYGVAFAIIAICFPISSVANSFGPYLLGKQNFKTYSLYGIYSGGIYFVAAALTAIYVPNFVYLVAAYYLSTTLGNAFFCIRTLRRYPPQLPGLAAEDTQYAKHLSFMTVVGSIANQVDSILVYQLLGPAQLAIYAFSTIIPDRIRIIFSSIMNAALPKMAEKKTSFTAGLSRKLLQMMVLAIIVIAVYIVAAPLFYTIFFPQYEASVWYSQIYALSLLMLPSFISLPALYAQRRERPLYLINIGIPIIKIVISLIAILLWGVLGAVLAKLIHYMLHLALTSYYAVVPQETT